MLAASRVRAKEVFDTAVKDGGDPERNGERGVIPALLDGNDGLTGHPEFIGEPLLRPAEILTSLGERILHQDDRFSHRNRTVKSSMAKATTAARLQLT